MRVQLHRLNNLTRNSTQPFQLHTTDYAKEHLAAQTERHLALHAGPLPSGTGRCFTNWLDLPRDKYRMHSRKSRSGTGWAWGRRGIKEKVLTVVPLPPALTFERKSVLFYWNIWWPLPLLLPAPPPSSSLPLLLPAPPPSSSLPLLLPAPPSSPTFPSPRKPNPKEVSLVFPSLSLVILVFYFCCCSLFLCLLFVTGFSVTVISSLLSLVPLAM